MFLIYTSFVQAAVPVPPATNSNNAADNPAAISKPINTAGHLKEISVFALSADGRYAITGDENQNNYLWDVTAGALIHPVGTPEPSSRIRVVAAGFSPDTSTLLWVRFRKHMPVLWEVKSGKRLGVLSSKDKGHLSEVVSLAFSGDGKYVATGDIQGTIVLWNMKDRTPVRRFKAHAGKVGFLSFIPGRAEFVSSGDDGAVRLWMVARSLVTNLKEAGPGVTAMTVSSDGSVLYAAFDDGAVRGWNVSLRSVRGTIRFEDRQINSISISPDGDLMALAEEDESILVWKIHESKVAWVNKLDNSALQVKFSPDGKTLFTSGGDNWVREWEASSGRFVRKFAGAGE